MFIRAYLRASTSEQDATRASESLENFVSERGHRIAARYVENASGASSERVELRRLLQDAQPGDILLVEAIDRLSRLPQKAWEALRAEIEGKGLRVVALDLPTSHAALGGGNADEFTRRMLDGVAIGRSQIYLSHVPGTMRVTSMSIASKPVMFGLAFA
ncbi:MAG: recombinase family protein, partial [Xanthomonadales bacterium]|nr:recombinase family protein [Xanthomonadales bacterium]